MNDRELIIGLDLGNDYSQVSYALNPSDEPISISLDKQGEDFLIPTVLGLSKEDGQWVYGKEAINVTNEGKAMLANYLLDKISKGEAVKLYESSYDSLYLLERYIYKILLDIKARYPDKTIRQMVVTIARPEETLVTGIYKALENLGLNRDRVFVQSYAGSYFSYVLSQEKGIWTNDIALFDFGERGFNYTQMSINRRQVPHLVEVRQKSYNDFISYDELENVKDNGSFDYILNNIINDALYMQIISSIYFTGRGFLDGVPMTTINKISKGRRIFIGQNLYCKGACYYGSHLVGEGRLDNFVFLLDDTIHYSITITVNDDEEDKTIYLGKLGRSVYEGTSKIGLILDEERQVKYQVRDRKGHIILEDIIVLDNMPNRPNKTSRIEVSLIVINKSRFKLQVKDMGFGEMYPSSDKVWEKEVAISG